VLLYITDVESIYTRIIDVFDVLITISVCA